MSFLPRRNARPKTRIIGANKLPPRGPTEKAAGAGAGSAAKNVVVGVIVLAAVVGVAWYLFLPGLEFLNFGQTKPQNPVEGEVSGKETPTQTTGTPSETSVGESEPAEPVYSVGIQSASCVVVRTDVYGYSDFALLASGVASGPEETEFQAATNPLFGDQEWQVTCADWNGEPALQQCRRGIGDPETTSWTARFGDGRGRKDGTVDVTARVFGNDGTGLAADDFTTVSGCR